MRLKQIPVFVNDLVHPMASLTLLSKLMNYDDTSTLRDLAGHRLVGIGTQFTGA